MKTIFLSSILKEQYSDIADSFEDLQKHYDINIKYLNNTNDIWARDYMPIQTHSTQLVQYQYQPDYLKGKKYQHLLTDVNHVIPNEVKVKVKKTDIVLDGGNFVRYDKKVIMTDKVYKENPKYTKDELSEKIKKDFEIDELIIIPKQPYDRYGHSDSMVRWIDSDTVLVNDFSIESDTFNNKLFNALNNHNLDVKKMEYEDGFLDKNRDWGAYLNFIKTDEFIIIPIYERKNSKKAYQTLQEIYKDVDIQLINCEKLIENGGALHCISWDISI